MAETLNYGGMSYLVHVDDLNGNILETVGFFTKRKAEEWIKTARLMDRYDDYSIKLYKLIESE